MYEQITSYLGKLTPGHWKYPEKQGDGSKENPYIAGWIDYDETTEEFISKMYEVVPNGGKDYGEVLREINQKYGDDYYKVDISKLNGDMILYMMFAVIRGERFCEGIISKYIEKGTMDKWLTRLKELDEKYGNQNR